MKNRSVQITAVLLLAIVLSLFVFPGQTAYAYSNPTLTLSEFLTSPGAEFTTTLTIAPDAQIVDFQARLCYDTELVTLVAAEENDSAAGNLVINTATVGVVDITYSRTKNTSKETPVLDLTFAVDPNAGVGIYDCFWVENNPGFPVKADRLNGSTPVQVPLETDFLKLQIYEMGNVDLSPALDITDATILRRYLVGLNELNEFQLALADTCYDGVVDITDATYIQRKLVNLKVFYGNRVNVYFYDADGNRCGAKSVLFGGDLVRLPGVPDREGYQEGRWSASPTEYVEPTLTGIEEEMSLYAVYTEAESDAIAYYRSRIGEIVYSGDLATNLNGNLDLPLRLDYQSGRYAAIAWASSNNYVLNSTTGEYTKPTYPTQLTLTAQIVAYDANGAIEGRENVDFVYLVPGAFETPTKAEIQEWLEDFFTAEDGYLVNYDLKLPVKVTSEEVPNANGKDYEVRISWNWNNNGKLEPIGQIKRDASSKDMDLVATVTFNGEPLEGDGKVFLDGVHVTAITQYEIKNYIINQIAASMGPTLSDGYQLWNESNIYGAEVHWQSGNVELASIANNKLNISTATVDGTLFPLIATVSYLADGEPKTFDLNYTVSLHTDNELLVPGVNISAELHQALKDNLRDAIPGFSGDITTGVLRDYRFVSLDLSGYPDITDLYGLSYCRNLRALNISGLHIEHNINQIATLEKLEAFVARGCDLNNLSDGGAPVLGNSIYLKLLDLSDNHFTSLDSVLAADKNYGKLREVYLNGNQLTDISALTKAPVLVYLSLADNGLQSEDIDQLAEFPYLGYLSLANNQISDISALQNLTNLHELRLQNNQITDVRLLQRLIRLQALYLGNNNISYGVDFLNNLRELRVLYLNDNNIGSISALRDLTHLESINVSNNPELNSLAILANYTETLEEVFAENDAITSFSFIDGMTKLRILMLSGNAIGNTGYSDLLSSQLSGLTQLEVLTLSDKPLRDLSFLNSMPNLVRFDAANCSLTGEPSDLAALGSLYRTLEILDLSNNDMSGAEDAVSTLRYLSNLKILYADNLCDSFDAVTITREMAGLKYLSLENCGITDLGWLTYLRELRYLDLAGNEISHIDLGTHLVRSKGTLRYLYLDTDQLCSFDNAFVNYDQNVLRELSLEGVTVGSMRNLPEMDQIRYLNLAHSGLTSLDGGVPEQADFYTIARYETLRVLDISGVEADISPVKDVPGLQTLYAVSTPEQRMFYESNLHNLKELHESGINCYLYDRQDRYAPVATREGHDVLDLLDDYSCAIDVAAEFKISDNNPVLPEQVNDFNITWSVSDNQHFEIKDSQIAVKDYSDIDDETIALTATITVYPDQQTVSRSFMIDIHVLRVEDFADISSTEPIDTQAFLTNEEVDALPDEPDGLIEEQTEEELETDEEITEDLNSEVMDEAMILENDAEASAPLEDTLEMAEELIPEDAEIDRGENEPGLPDNNSEETTDEQLLAIEEDLTANNADEIPGWLEGEEAAKFASAVSCLEYNISGLDDYMNREDDFIYQISICAAEYPGFSEPVKPVEDEIRYAFNTVLENGSAAPYKNVLEKHDEGSYHVLSSAPLNSTTVITTTVGHYVDADFIPDQTMQRSFQVTSRSYMVTYVVNGGTVTLKDDGSVITSQRLPEDALMFQNVTTSRTGYLFGGWFRDEAFTQLFYDGTTPVTMPAEDITLYAKWTAHSYNISFDANGGSVQVGKVNALCDQPIGELPVPTRPLYSFLGWYTERVGGEQITANSTRTTAEDIVLYAHWQANSHTVTFNANTGSEATGVNVSMSTKTVTCDSPIGALPSADQYYYDFVGWYTASAGGTEVTEETIVTTDSDFTLYAHWIIHPLSGWVRADAVPSNATPVNDKWSYTKTTKAESTSSTMSGFSQIGSYWNQTGNGSKQYASFPSTYNTSHWTYKQLNGSAYSAYENESAKRTVSNTHAGYIYWHWAYNAAYANNTGRWISDRNQTAGSSRNLTDYVYKYFYAFTSTTNAPTISGFTYTWGANGKYNADATTYNCSSCLPSGADTGSTSGLNNPRFLRLKYYTSTYTDYQKIYQFQKVENLESPTEVAPSDTISNVIHWVQYREK